ADKAQIVNVELGWEQFEINVVIPNHNLYRMEGKIVAGKDKTPMKGAAVYLKRKGEDSVSIFNEIGGTQHNSMTDDEGKWSFKELPKGTYQVVVEPPAVYNYTYANTVAYATNAVNTASNVDRSYGSMTNSRPN